MKVKVVNKEFGLDKKTRRIIILCNILLFSSLIGSYVFIKNQAIKRTDYAIKSNVLETNHKTSIIIKEELYEKQQILKLLSSFIVTGKYQTMEEVMEYLKSYVDAYGFYNLGIITSDGKCYTTLDQELDLNGYDYVERGFQGESLITEDYAAEIENKILNIFVEPVKVDEKVRFLLTASYQTEDFVNILNI